MLLGTLLILFIVLAFIAALAGVCAFAILTFVVGIAFRSSRFAWLSPFLIWIPSLAAAFAVSFTAYSAYALAHSFSFPADPLEFLIALFFGELLSIGLGVAIAISVRKRKVLEDTHAA